MGSLLCVHTDRLIMAVNVLVWMLWQTLPFGEEFMERYFTTHHSNPPLPSLVLSSFSHYDLLHLYVNMSVFASMSQTVMPLYGCRELFLFYIMGGMSGSVTSIAIRKLLNRHPLRTVGASGATTALFAIVALTVPQVSFSVLHLEEMFQHSIPAHVAFMAVIVFELTGLALDWTVFDHGAHLGGLLFGTIYAKSGTELQGRVITLP